MSHVDVDVVRAAVDAAASQLPPQPPLARFIHFISLQGDLALPFGEAVRRARERRGASGWPSAERVRSALRTGRLTRADVEAALGDALGDAGLAPIVSVGGRTVRPLDLGLLALEAPIVAVEPPTLRDRLRAGALRMMCEGVEDEAARRLLRGRPPEAVLTELWTASLALTGASDGDPRALSADLEAPLRAPAATRAARLARARALASAQLSEAGRSRSLAETWAPFAGRDLGADVASHLTPWLARFADEGVAAWRSSTRHAGFWPWLQARVAGERAWPWRAEDRAAVLDLPADPFAAIAEALVRLGVSGDRAAASVEREVMALQGWGAMAAWYGAHPDDREQAPRPLGLAHVVAARLALSLAAIGAVAASLGLDARLGRLAEALEATPDALLVLHAAFVGELDDELEHRVVALRERGVGLDDRAWTALAHAAFTRSGLRADDAARRAGAATWRLFQVAQRLGLDADALHAIGPEGVGALLAGLDALDADLLGGVGLDALERTWMDEVGRALVANRAAEASAGPSAQVVTCIDDREESLRRHLEELDPSVHTFGAAGFFSVPMLFQGLADAEASARCPVVVEPRHLVREVERAGLRPRPIAWKDRALAILGVAPPVRVPTRLAFTAHEAVAGASRASPQEGYTDAEQVDAVASALVGFGIAKAAPLVVILGHAARTTNNPYQMSYGCGACAGNPGGQNARLLAAMANRPAVRRELAARGLVVPDDTWFLGAEHDTAADRIDWFDLEDLPQGQEEAFGRLRATLDAAAGRAAHERVRRLPLAPREVDVQEAHDHVRRRALDPRQPRPELGHTGNALAVLGRRALTRGLFLDRRAFLVSYDAAMDPDGSVLEATLMAAGPVGAQINLDYYFSSTDPAGLGAGTKAGQNLVAGLGVLQGAEGDLRTGLPWQMIEQHEPMRLLLVVEATQAHLGQVHARRPVIRHLLDGAWVHLIAVDPEDGSLARFVPGVGFVPWQPSSGPVPVRTSSRAWYEGHHGFLGLARIVPEGHHDAA